MAEPRVIALQLNIEDIKGPNRTPPARVVTFPGIGDTIICST